MQTGMKPKCQKLFVTVPISAANDLPGSSGMEEQRSKSIERGHPVFKSTLSLAQLVRCDGFVSFGVAGLGLPERSALIQALALNSDPRCEPQRACPTYETSGPRPSRTRSQDRTQLPTQSWIRRDDMKTTATSMWQAFQSRLFGPVPLIGGFYPSRARVSSPCLEKRRRGDRL